LRAARPSGLDRFFKPVGSMLPAAFKEKNMKRTIALCLAVLGLALLPALAQTTTLAPNKGRVHGHVTNPSGSSQAGGTVSFTEGPLSGAASKFTVDANGDYSADVPPGTYRLIYRGPDIPEDKETDHKENVKVTVGGDVVADIDMSRKEYIDALSPEQKKQLDDMKKHNAEALKANEVIKHLNADLAASIQDLKEADAAKATAAQTLGATASKADLDAKESEIKTAKYTDIETMMQRDTAAKPDASILWGRLGQAEAGLKKYDAAETAFKKTLEVDAASKKQDLNVQGMAQAGLGEVYARTGKVPEANAAYDAAAKLDPTRAGMYYKNEAVIFFQANNGDAQAAAAQKAIDTDPAQPIPYYLKANALIQKTTLDEKTKKLVPPPGCLEAYQKYLELQPNGIYAAEVKQILASFSSTVDNTYKATSKKKGS
jgi:tetratricopeptide (TPR) repeat protein